jgi:enediyne biosynthesis protein E4
MGVVAADYDGDGDQDIFVANDVMANFLLRNDGTGKFTEVAALAGTAFDLTGKAQASMGVDAADFDNDGRVDFHVTSYSGEFATLYRNLGGGVFEDATRITGAGEGTFPHVTWGNAFADFDNDGHRDLFVACGHLDDNIHLRGGAAGTAFDAPNVVLRNLGNRRFQNVSASSGEGLKPAHSSRGVAVGDLDGNGRLDVVVLNSRQPPTLLRNDTSSGNHWLAVRLIGRDSNRSGVGAAVTVHVAGTMLFDEVRSGRGYQSHFGEWLHFGLGPAQRADKIVVRWPSGSTLELNDIPADQKWVWREPGLAIVPTAPVVPSRDSE